MQKKKAFKIVCPGCKGVAYSTIKPETDIPCPYCGCMVKWKLSKEKTLERVEKEAV